MSIRLGFHYHIPMVRSQDGSLRTPGYLGRFLDSIALHCDSVTCFMHSPRFDEIDQMDYVVQSQNVILVNIGLHTSTLKRILYSSQFSKPLSERCTALDALLLRGPSPLLPSMAKAAGNVPTALLLVGDYLAGVNDLPQPRWRKEAIRIWSYWNYRQQMAVARKSLTFVNSHKLYEQLKPYVPNLHETRTTTLTNRDFYAREDTCLKSPYQLLYTGRMDRAKGLMQIVEAVDLLVQDGIDLVLNLVGWAQKGDPILEEILDYAHKHGISDRLKFHGLKSVGPELFAYYRLADIYIIASQSDFEGFPRTIWEALAHSLPVIATRVGSIPTFLVNNSALLVKPLDSMELAHAIRQIISNSLLRKTLITNGIHLARTNTLEIRSKEMIDQIRSWLQK